MSTSATPDQLRSLHRQRRAALDGTTQRRHAEALSHRLLETAAVHDAQHIAAYIAIRGEISLEVLFLHLQRAGKQLYLPVLRGEAMHFSPWSVAEPLVKKGFGLLEPNAPESSWISPVDLDLVLAPLVVFDDRRNRIGQGGGYYDRTFAFRSDPSTTKPLLLGVAHEQQREPKLTPEHWDVTLDLIATEKALYSG